MVLKVRYVRTLSDVVEPVASWLRTGFDGRGVFGADHILLPANGAKAWLLPELAQRVGNRPGKNDGVIANVQVGYLGSLNKFIVPQRFHNTDPWSIESMTAAILGLIAKDPLYESISRRTGGAL
ncbi:MAG: hypothetical protein EBV24_10010, partial [Actinobacteria bacterium]|nr:hypothetical protein [Actinomycetota bacterium]